MDYKVLFDDKVIKDLKKIDFKWQKIILNNINNTLVKNPFSGKRLLGDFSDYYTFRVGDYRVIYEILEKELIIVVKIGHRKDVHRK